jgi:hypothetical protein
MHQLPKRFCWTKFGTESGESIGDILARKEQERIAQDGLFLWGIGNSVGPAIRELVELEKHPKVIFSPMRSKAKAVDSAPTEVLTWTTATTLNGDDWAIPAGINVVSRGASEGGRTKASHYALVCKSETPLQIEETSSQVVYEDLVNLLSKNKLGHSQVTAVVESHETSPGRRTPYPAAFLAELVFPFFVRLADPITTGPESKRSQSRVRPRAIESRSLLDA